MTRLFSVWRVENSVASQTASVHEVNIDWIELNTGNTLITHKGGGEGSAERKSRLKTITMNWKLRVYFFGYQFAFLLPIQTIVCFWRPSCLTVWWVGVLEFSRVNWEVWLGQVSPDPCELTWALCLVFTLLVIEILVFCGQNQSKIWGICFEPL